MRKFKVASGKVKECIQDENGNWVTAKKGWLVALEDGRLLNGCSVHVEEEVDEWVPDSSWLKDDIKAWLSEHDIEYKASAVKNELLKLVG